MGKVKWVLLAVIASSVAVRADDTATRLLFADNGPVYVGGQGLVTLEGVTGMFLNPTSGTLPSGQLTVQYCAAIRQQNDRNVIWNQPMVAYGITDWLQLGAFAVINDAASVTTAAGGPWLRVRVIKDEEWWPELSVGGIIREGNSHLRRETVFLAGSKGFPINYTLLHEVRLHTGFRQLWQDSDVNPADGSIVYVGGELGLPKNLYAIAEISNRSAVYAHTPYAFGLQARLPQGFGFSLAGIQSGNDQGIGVYIGIGVNFL